jgi:hypothetical protein
VIYPRLVSKGFEPLVCEHCKWYRISWNAFFDPDSKLFLCESCVIMKASQPQRFGKLVRSFGSYGELRRQKKPPQLEVFYLPIKSPKGDVLRSVNRASAEAISEHIQMVGERLANHAIQQEAAEIVLDYCYAELNRRLNKDAI